MSRRVTQTKKDPRPLVLFATHRPMLVFILVALIVCTWAGYLVFIQENTEFDQAVFEAISPYTTPILTRIIVFISFLGKHTFLVPVNLLLLAFFLYRKKKRLAIRLLVISLSSLSLKLILKALFNRPRPGNPLIEHVSGLSFPSGHAMLGVTFYGLMILILLHEVKNCWWRNAIIGFFVILILLIAFSRVYLRVHYVSDVITGLAVGFIWLTVSLYIIEKIEAHYIKRKTED
jgi:membrane-associated phospholipid phosphatase